MGQSDYFSCSNCGKNFTKDEFSQMEKAETPLLPNSQIIEVSAICPDCNKNSTCTVNLENGVLLPYALNVDDNCTKEMLKQKFNSEIRNFYEANEGPPPPDEFDDADYYTPYPLDDTVQPIQEEQSVAQGPTEPVSEGTQWIEDFKAKIKSIDKNLSEIERNNLIMEALKGIADKPSSAIDGCYAIIKDEFKLNARTIEAFRKDLNLFQDQKKKLAEKAMFDKLSAQPKELTEQEKAEALAFLQDPNILMRISKDMETTGEIVGERINRMMVYLACVSRKFSKPISLVIFGQSSSGKSFIANRVAEFIPDEDKFILSSSSPRAFDYMGEKLKHKFILIQEFEGIESVLPTIRILQSEGRLARLIPVKNPDDNTTSSDYKNIECPCSVIFTTTKESIHDENSTRIFELYSDETIKQTENIVQQSILKANIYNKTDEAKRKRIIDLHQNAQRLLEPIEVSIPYTEHLSFPKNTSRNRRDVERFIQLIKVVAFLRQKQKPTQTFNGKPFIEADLIDYGVAYEIGAYVLSATLDKISDRARKVLRVCCELADDLKKVGQTQFTVNQIQEKASDLKIDLHNRRDLYKQLDDLAEKEYLSCFQAHKGSVKNYTVIFNYARDDFGNLININAPEIKEIITPEELSQKLQTN